MTLLCQGSRVEAEESARLHRLKELCAAAVSFSSSVDLDRTVNRIAREAIRVLECSQCVVLLLDDTGEHLRPRATAFKEVTPPSPSRNSIRIQTRSREAALLLGLRRACLLDAQCIERTMRTLSLAQPGQSTVVVVPMLIDGAPVGMLLLVGTRITGHAIDQFYLELAELYGTHAAVAVRNAQSVRSVSRQLFETVSRSKREWEQTFDAIGDGVFVTSTDHFVVRANHSFTEMLKTQFRGVIGQKCYEVLRHRATVCDDCPVKGSGPTAMWQSSDCLANITLPDLIAQISAYPIVDRRGKLSAVVHVVKDVTERERMQELFVQTEKLRAVGEMASGVAHDFNNLLSSIVGWSEVMLLSNMEPDVRACAEAIRRATSDGTEIVRRIQDYTRIRKETEFTSVDINDALLGAAELARPRWKDWAEKAGIVFHVTTDLGNVPPVRGNPSDLRDVFLNIIFNAIDAMSRGGEIRLATRSVGNRVVASVTDNGQGMDEETKKRAFDPFFSTKGAAGSGLGLSVAFGIIARHNGRLSATSEVGQGSTFTVELPATKTAAPERHISDPVSPKNARIMLVDDDERVLVAVEAMLRSDGHTVSSCLGGEQGLAALATGQFDIVITDLGMPGLNGCDIAARAKMLDTKRPVVILTGWGAELAVDSAKQLGVNAILRKPCRISDLRHCISRLLSEASPQASPVAPSSLDAKALRVLVVDDNKMFSEALGQRLRIEGLSVTLANSGVQALGMAVRAPFDMVMVDIKLPDRSGIDVAGRMKQLAGRPVVVVMSGDPGLLAADHIEEACDFVLRKPWKESELRGVIEFAVARKAAPDRELAPAST